MSECLCLRKDGEKCRRICDEGVCWQHQAQILNGSKLIHSTTIESMLRIVDNGILYDSGELIKRQIFMAGGEGNLSKRKCCNPYDYPIQEDIPSWCLEACATYFRLLRNETPIPKPKAGKCILRFSTVILCKEGVEWHINTMENNGFLISNNSAYYGHHSEIPSRTLLKKDINLIGPSDFSKNLEVVITSSVPTDYLLAVYFGSEKDYNENKLFLVSNNITPILMS